MAKDTKKGGVTSVNVARKADTSTLITNGADAFPEDSFVGTYWTGGATANTAILEPQFKPGVLYALVAQNNTLAQCIEAMEVNIDGTGHSITLVEDAKENEKEKEILNDFFKEPYPGKTMIDIRRAIRRDREATGNGYLEVIRNLGDEVVMLNAVDCTDFRLLRLDDPVEVDRPLTRAGKEVMIRHRTRERRYVQMINGKKVYFKEFGASRDVNRDTGEWAAKGERLPADKRGSEIIHFGTLKEPKTPYFAPRWINQLPSVLGSRKAEEHNLDFFDAGGLPPVLVIVQGGTLGDTVREELKSHLAGSGTKHRAAIVEAISTSGSLDSAGSVQVRVERFGAERQQDAMFQTYDKNCEEHVRTGFRLPPIFIGKASDYNFATAYTAYMVAEAQVFYPERDSFDAVINTKIVRALGVKSYKFRSLPMTLVDVEKQLKALELGLANKCIDMEEAVKSLNEITGLELEYAEPPKAPEAPQGKVDPITGLPYTQPAPPPPHPSPVEGKTAPESSKVVTGGTKDGTPTKQKASASPATKEEVVVLAHQWAVATGLVQGSISDSERVVLRRKVEALEEDDLDLFNRTMATEALNHATGLDELCGCAAHLTGE